MQRSDRSSSLLQPRLAPPRPSRWPGRWLGRWLSRGPSAWTWGVTHRVQRRHHGRQRQAELSLQDVRVWETLMDRWMGGPPAVS